MKKICRCFKLPREKSFKKEGLYKWEYTIDGYTVYDDNGKAWSEGEIEFYCHFQILKGKE